MLRRRTVTLALGFAAVLGGCASSAPVPPVALVATPSIEPSTTAASTPDPIPAATPVSTPLSSPAAFSPPADASEPPVPADLARTATETRDGIRVTVTLQRNPMPAGELSWVRTTVKNVGDTTATWFHDGCATAVGIGGEAAQPWRPGVDHDGQAQAFKDAVLGRFGGETAYRRPAVSFVAKEDLTRGSFGCADIGISEKLRPGETLKATRWWSGRDAATKALPSSGPVRLSIWSGYFWRGPEPERIVDKRIEFTLDAWITGGWSPTRPTPPEVVDAALRDPAFLEYLDTQELHSGREAILWYDAKTDRWEVGVMPWYETDPPRIHGVLVDATTGRVTGVLDREWNEALDGFPY